MPIYAVLSVNNETNKITKEAFNLEKYGFFARMSLKNLLRALAMDFSKKVRNNTNFTESSEGYTTIEEKLNDEKIVIVTKKDDKRRVVLVTDGDYGHNVRYKALMEAMQVGADYEQLVEDYKDWNKKDTISLIEQEMRKANENVVKGLSAVLDRGESLNDLVEKSEHLSSQTKKLYQQAKKQNSCCK